MSWINNLLDPLNVAVLKSLLRCKDGDGIIVYASTEALINKEVIVYERKYH
jgi:nitrous oxidase accessory protein NosD